MPPSPSAIDTMNADTTTELGATPRRVQSLVNYCQRVAASHVDAIDTFGQLQFEIIEPILESCTAQQLLRFERDSPDLETKTFDIWKKLCMRQFPLAAELYASTEREEPASWRDEYFDLEDAEARRLEVVASRLRSKRQAGEDRKKEKEVKLTDRMPTMKRARWNHNQVQPKTLFERTRTVATRVAKGAFRARMNPKGPLAIPNAPSTRLPVLPPSSRASINSGSPSSGASARTSNVVMTRRPALPSVASSPSAFSSHPAPTFNSSRVVPTPLSSPPQFSQPTAVAMPSPPVPSTALSPSITRLAVSPPVRSPLQPSPPRVALLPQAQSAPPRTDITAGPPRPPPNPARKGKTSALFMPKHRAYSQLSAQSSGLPSR